MSKEKAKKTGMSVPRRVLVVEDDAILALAIEDALQDVGVEDVVICGSTEQALKALRAERPDAMILDVHLADRDDGWALAELVDRVGPNPPRIVFSTAAPQDIPEEIAQLGAILEKPYDTRILGQLLLQERKTGIIGRLKSALTS